MANRSIIVIGASAGGIPALRQLVHGLPADLPAALLIVLHMSRHSSGLLAEILAKSGPLPATNARQGEAIRDGHIYVAPPDCHLLIGERGRIQIGHGPKENRFRPAVDPLFRSAALAYGPEVIGIILSGGLDDGTAGLCLVKQAGGVAIVQDPAEAEAPSMPRSAMRHVQIDHCLPVAKIAGILPKLVNEPAEKAAAMPDNTKVEVEIAADERCRRDVFGLGEPSVFTCPSCNGGLTRVHAAGPVRFRCHTGHAYTSITLEDELRETVESSTWSAVRALQEHANLLTEMARQADASSEEIADYNARAELALKRARLLREAIALGDDDSGTN